MQHQDSQVANGNKYVSFEYKSGMDNGRTASSSDHESQYVPALNYFFAFVVIIGQY